MRLTMRSTLVGAAVFLVAGGAIGAACGDFGASDDPAISTSPAPDRAGTTIAAGSRHVDEAPGAEPALLVVDGVRMPFAVTYCGFDPEDAGNRNVRLVVEGEGGGEHGRFLLFFADVNDGTRRLRQLEIRFENGRVLTHREQVISHEPSGFAFDAQSMTLAGSTSMVASGSEAPATPIAAIQATCPAFADHQQGQLRLR